jgi:hypothetical protein
MLRANSRLRGRLGDVGVDLLTYAAGAFERILPHVESLTWAEVNWEVSRTTWTNQDRKEIRVTVAIGEKHDPVCRSLTAIIKRRQLPTIGGVAGGTLDSRERDICERIADRISDLVRRFLASPDQDAASIRAIRGSFDEAVVAEHINEHHQVGVQVSSILAALHTLSEQTYENKALVFGCVLDPDKLSNETAIGFPEPFLSAKKYKALSDGFRTAYHVSADGAVIDFVDLDKTGSRKLSTKHYFPEWAGPIARVSRDGRCGIALTRQGDILVFDEGILRFTYRFGRWRYWNHSHVVNLLRDRARAQKVPRSIVGHVVGSIYRAALDISFRRSGGLFVIIHSQQDVRKIVRKGDAIGDATRGASDRDFDRVVQRHKMQAISRGVAVEIASLDGAVVLANSGKILAYGAVLQPKKAGQLRGSEGSRTKAAIGASNYGLAVKISSDGDITVYFAGLEFFRI